LLLICFWDLNLSYILTVFAIFKVIHPFCYIDLLFDASVKSWLIHLFYYFSWVIPDVVAIDLFLDSSESNLSAFIYLFHYFPGYPSCFA
jgi:hypothetical protein